MKRKNGKLVFERSDQIKPYKLVLRIPGFSWGNYALFFRANYISGNLFTNLNSPVNARLLIKDSVELHIIHADYRCDEILRNQDILDPNIVNLSLKGAITKDRPDILKQVKLAPEYNCFGYCFGDSKYFIPDPVTIIRDEYDFVKDPAKAEKILLLAADVGTNEFGENPLSVIHAVNVNPDRTISFKPGITELIENVGGEHVPHSYNFNRMECYKQRIVK